ncbi:ATP-binding cassette domain-containing protein [Planctomycetota bacterium]
MSCQQLLFNSVSFNYDTLSDPIFNLFSLRLGRGFAGVVGPNGSGKSTLLKLAAGELVPQQGDIHSPGHARYCAQRTDHPPKALSHFMNATDPPACRIKGQLRLDTNWLQRWETLSHGERKRAQIAVALWQDPHVLAIDEPSNHMDEEGRLLLLEALRTYSGIGLIVSHDRVLLDTLCVQTLWIDPPTLLLRPGGYSKSKALNEADRKQHRHTRDQLKQRLGRLQGAKTHQQKDVSQSKKRNSKRGLQRRDSDQRAKRDLARLTGKDGQPGRKLKRLAVKETRLHAALAQTQVQKDSSYKIALVGEHYRGDTLVTMESNTLHLGECKRLDLPELTVRPHDRIGLVGPNGAGKSTLIRHIVARLDLPPDRTIYLPQEIAADEASKITTEARRLSKSMLGELMTFVGCLGSKPQRLLETECPSPGEMRKLLLALGMLRSPYVIIMDEPTNHLDLPSIEAMERALQACNCALLLVSHDREFLCHLTTTTWNFSQQDRDREHWILTVSNC